MFSHTLKVEMNEGDCSPSELIEQGVKRTAFRYHSVSYRVTGRTPARHQRHEDTLNSVAVRPQLEAQAGFQNDSTP